MVVGDSNINIMSGIENASGVKQHSHKKKLRQRFDIIRKLGQGTFGKVQLGINKETGQEVAIKTIKKSKIESEADLVRIRREIQIMSSVQHPNIIHIYEVFENREKMVLVMEYAAGGELYDYLSERKVLQEDEARRIFRQIATACYYCHKHKICHRDLKLENILLDENNNAKIADFGLSNVFDNQRLLNTFCGSPLYASPEIVKGTPYHGPEVDCWSLGVLLYTLVYGAMPFDGSNFKRLVKQISQGDYFEPAKPSPASPLIREMLTVNPKHRSDIEKICSHWWVNETYDQNCLDISEELANQTPVRLDLLLSLAPPPPQLESEKLLVTGDDAKTGQSDIAANTEITPARSQSVGSLMELSHPAERRIQQLINNDEKPNKRKLESTVSAIGVNVDRPRKDKIIKENTIADITVAGASIQDDGDTNMRQLGSLNKSLTQTIQKDVKVESGSNNNETITSAEGAACVEILREEEAKQNQLKNTLSIVPSQENVKSDIINKENIIVKEETATVCKEETKEATVKPKKKLVKKKVLTDKNDNATTMKQVKNDEKKNESSVQQPTKPIERRRSRIFEVAEKFQNMITPSVTETKPLNDKPKKIIIPGVSVDGFKKEFERKASLTSSSSPPKTLLRKSSLDSKQSNCTEQVKKESPATTTTTNNEERKEMVKNAVNIISSALLDKDGTRKSKSRPCCVKKPPVPFGVGGRSASGNIGEITPLSPTTTTALAKTFVQPVKQVEEAKQIHEETEEDEQENKTSCAEITLKSATLPRRKTTKAEIKLNYPSPKPITMEFKTEMAHPVEAAPTRQQQQQVTVPVNITKSELEKSTTKERIIPIAYEKVKMEESTKPPMPKTYQTQKSNSSNLSRQSTQESDSETTSISGGGGTGEPIRKSPREYIIPIAVEGGGYVTPRAGSLEPTDSASTTSTMTSKSRTKFGRARRINSILSDRESEDESLPFATMHKHSSFGNKENDKDDTNGTKFHHMHRLRSSRPRKTNLEHTDSVSSGEDDDDDDGFEILTAENLFSTLLSRVRDLTQRLNVEDSPGRPGFPSSRLLSHFDHGTNFWNFHNRLDPLSRHSSLRGFNRDRINSSNNSGTDRNLNAPWRRSVSRDLASDIESVFSDSNQQRPRGARVRVTVHVPCGPATQNKGTH